jgi:C1A family cysteine protease
MILCMTNMELYAAETDSTGSGGLEEEMQTAVDETEVMETVSLYLEKSESAETDDSETADKETTETETAETEPDETETETVETEPDETETKPDETEPDETETQISETETVASEIAETEALETELTDEQSEQSVEELLSELQEEVDRQFQEDGYCASGYIDSGFEADRLGNPAFGRRTFGLYADRETLPSAYSAVDAGQVSAIRNQGAWGTCWSFAAMAAAESAYKKLYGREADLSETHLVNFFYHDGLAGPDGGLKGDKVIPLTAPKVNQGGNNVFTTFALARWTGAADEALDSSLVYPLEDSYRTKELTIDDQYAYQDVLHMQNAYWLNKNDLDSVKRAVMDKGAVSIYYKYSKNNDSRYVDTILEKYGQDKYSGPAVYYYQPMNDQEGHGVAVVGWDDNFDRNNFAYSFINQQEVLVFGGKPSLPEKNGAWLVKNSWGSEYGDNGYFWMSYEDASLSDTMLVFDFEKADNYDHIYQYDGAAGVRYEKGDKITAAAVYTSTGNQMVEAAGIGIASVETDYTIEVYTGLTDVNDPQSGRLCSRTAGTTAFQGYHTIRLDEYVLVPKGDLFSIVVTLSSGKVKDEPGAAIFVDQSYDNGGAVRFVAKTNPSETFVKTNEGWTDAAREEAEEKFTYRIKDIHQMENLTSHRKTSH